MQLTQCWCNLPMDPSLVDLALQLVDLDLVLVDLARSHEVRNAEQQTKCKWSPWDGETLVGLPVRTWVMGHNVYCDGTFNDQQLGQEARFDHARGGYWKTTG